MLSKLQRVAPIADCDKQISKTHTHYIPRQDERQTKLWITAQSVLDGLSAPRRRGSRNFLFSLDSRIHGMTDRGSKSQLDGYPARKRLLAERVG